MLRALVSVVSVVVVTTACSTGDEDCGVTERAVEDVGITQGIAGFGINPNRVCPSLFCGGCFPGDFAFDLYFAGAEAPADDVEAHDVLAASTPITISTGVDGYEQALEAGSWLACLEDSELDGCQLLVVDVDAVTTVHLVGENGPPELVVFDAAGDRVQPRTYRPRPSLPRLQFDADCQPITPPSLCAWATSADAVVTATITRIAALTTPAEKTTAPGEWSLINEDACNEVVIPGLLLTIDVNVALAGDMPASVVVHVGADHARLFDDSTGSLAIGDVIGLPLHLADPDDIEGGLWSLMGERLFFFVDDTVRFQQGAEACFAPPPVDVEGLRVEDFVDAFDACTDTTVGDERRAQQRRTWGPDGATPSAYRAGECTDPIP